MMVDALDILGFLLAMGIGMGCGSYATMPYYRLPNGIACAGKWIGKRSACPKCDIQLRTRDLFPVFNWLWTLGRCFNCGAKVNPVYFFIEASCMLLSILLYFRFGFDQFYIICMGLAVCLVILTATMYSYQVIPDPVLIVMVMFGFLYRTLIDDNIYDMVHTFAFAVLCGLAYTKLYERFRGEEVKHYGLLKLIAVAGIWFHIGEFLTFLLLAMLAYALVIIIARLSGFSVTLMRGFVLSLPFMLLILLPELPQMVLTLFISGGI